MQAAARSKLELFMLTTLEMRNMEEEQKLQNIMNPQGEVYGMGMKEVWK